MQPVGLVAFVARTLPGILDRQEGRDHQHLAQATPLVGLDQHPAEPGVDGKLRELLPDAGQPHRSLGFHRAQLGQQPQPVADLSRVRRLDEREVRDVAEIRFGHLQDHRCQVGA